MECMLDLMCDQFLWPCMAAQVKEHIRNCHPCLTFKAKQPKAPLKNIIATHPLELVHLNYLCLEPRKGLEENVLVVTDHFARYGQAYVTRTQTTQTNSSSIMGYQKRFYQIKVKAPRVSWWLISVCWWGPKRYRIACTTHRLTASVRMLCQRRNQSGRSTLEHWSMLKTAPRIQLQGSAPTTSSMGNNPASQ